MPTIGNILGQMPGVQTVNGAEPDAVGNAEIDVGVKTINNEQPDPQGNLNIDPKTWQALKEWNLETNWPVTSLWWSSRLIDPGEIVGGTWERVENVFILAASDKYPVDSTGGEAEHTLTLAEMPKHTHTVGTAPSSDAPVLPKWTAVGVESTENTPKRYWATNTMPAGEGQPHNNMPPYKAKYCWQRIS